MLLKTDRRLTFCESMDISIFFLLTFIFISRYHYSERNWPDLSNNNNFIIGWIYRRRYFMAIPRNPDTAKCRAISVHMILYSYYITWNISFSGFTVLIYVTYRHWTILVSKTVAGGFSSENRTRKPTNPLSLRRTMPQSCTVIIINNYILPRVRYWTYSLCITEFSNNNRYKLSYLNALLVR